MNQIKKFNQEKKIELNLIKIVALKKKQKIFLKRVSNINTHIILTT